ncbi:MAG: hypothetical protein C4536_11835 [Actinobacteria bacterium]|jgi:hypothetical protein|nr:MAG: hypothetical protein C4536_11835 [Actinomycetota bacterium]
MAERGAFFALIICIPLVCLAAAGCGQATPEQTVYKFLGAVQAHDITAMRSCVNPEALSKAAGGDGELARQWEELHRKYLVEPVNWRMEFEGIRLESSYLDRDRALVRLAGGRCELYNLKEGTWAAAGEIDFSTQDFVPLYVVMKDGRWYMEALDLYVVFGLESMARL